MEAKAAKLTATQKAFSWMKDDKLETLTEFDSREDKKVEIFRSSCLKTVRKKITEVELSSS